MRVLGVDSNIGLVEVKSLRDWLKITENYSRKNVIYLKRDRIIHDYLILNCRIEEEDGIRHIGWDSLILEDNDNIGDYYYDEGLTRIDEFFEDNATSFLDGDEEWAVAITGKEINKENIEEYWEEILKKVKRYENYRHG